MRIPAQCSAPYELWTSCLGPADRPTSSVGGGDLWQGCISVPELNGRDWGGVQVPRPEHISNRSLPQTLDREATGARLRTKPIGHFTKVLLPSSNKYLSAKV